MVDIGKTLRKVPAFANEAEEGRFGNVGGSLHEELVEPGIYNSQCGNDFFEFEWQGQRLLATGHIENGGNTPESRQRLPIYYNWYHETNQIVVAEMPAHRRAGASWLSTKPDPRKPHDPR